MSAELNRCGVCNAVIERDEVFYLRPDWKNFASPISSEMLPAACFQCYRCEHVEQLRTMVEPPPGVGLIQLRLDLAP